MSDPVLERSGPNSSRSAPVPPGSASLDPNGTLKDTAANRALFPERTPQEVFDSAALRESAYFHDGRHIVLHGDVREQLGVLRDAGVQVDCIVTSPPYYGQRDYGFDGQIGHESHPSAYVETLVHVFALCREVLRDTGSLWVNIGDTYWSGKGAHKSSEAKQGARRFGLRPQDRPGDGLWARPKQLLLLPHRLAIAMQDDGWLVRNDNVWVKPNPVPDQVRDRSSMSHEYVFHFTKSRYYFYDREAVGRVAPSGRILPPLDTWTVETARGGHRTHRASFSEDLAAIPIRATAPREHGVVLDPFVGSGTSMLVAQAEGLRSVGIDGSLAYCDETRAALRGADKP